ncbi:LOW QUALITY PROTEIN: ceramide-1-phosphate transfer protein-like [Bradysia coprophila]|uniref:LOW QUALITY PROTEIN: ceramide-1-phosphate transfer protein-like n=1 Tax=Bradysia coprophila TaxID=38358 RepID=UPI00187D7E4C|nr:LOW QUALITY PROTEIN: ceramide-1-phosphate transfer protein-like [Bradysia coprophila]
MAQDRFDLSLVHQKFSQSLHEINDNDIYVDTYLEGFTELNKFFSLMGTVFGFVSSDVKSKIEILEEFRRKENNEKFATFSSMLNYEKTTGLLNKSDYVSGSRTLLRLHRGLDFIREFLFNLGKLNPSEKTSTVCQAAYTQTLAQYHPWLVRKGAMVAMYTMPTRDQLLNKVCLDVERAIELLPEMLETTRNVYDRTQQLFTDFDLHGLP